MRTNKLEHTWRCVAHIDGLGDFAAYDVDNFGNVWSHHKGKRQLLKLRTMKAGYRHIVLSAGKLRKGMLVHRLVAMAFIPNPEDKPHVNHKDGNKANNHYKNLEWCTPQENIDHAISTGLATAGGGYKASARGKRKLSLEQVLWLINEYKEGYAISAMAKVLDVDATVIYQILGRVSYTDCTQGLEWPELDGSQNRKVYNKPRKPSDWY